MSTCGRPPIKCEELNKRIQDRKTSKGKSTLLKKCNTRKDHPNRPCTTDDGRCVSLAKKTTKTPPTNQKCKDANFKIGNLSKSEHKRIVTTNCKKISKDSGLNCTVNPKTRTCGDADVKAKKRKNALITRQRLM
tara:strand:+ start:478 stop:879 length:402 start_codon:yes stop_codon:yes gene_type:complete